MSSSLVKIPMTSFAELKQTVKQDLSKKYSNIHQVPSILKTTVSMCIKEATSNNKRVPSLIKYLEAITGQTPKKVYAKESVAQFHLREGMLIGLQTTLRGKNMYYFLEKLIYFVLQKVNNFNGLVPKNLDGTGNLNKGIDDIRVFPEVKRDQFDQEYDFKTKFGMNISINTSANTDLEAYELLKRFNFPFVQNFTNKIRGAK